jgi:hypothetical protein
MRANIDEDVSARLRDGASDNALIEREVRGVGVIPLIRRTLKINEDADAIAGDEATARMAHS